MTGHSHAEIRQGFVRKIWFMNFWNEIDRLHEARR